MATFPTFPKIRLLSKDLMPTPARSTSEWTIPHLRRYPVAEGMAEMTEGAMGVMTAETTTNPTIPTTTLSFPPLAVEVLLVAAPIGRIPIPETRLRLRLRIMAETQIRTAIPPSENYYIYIDFNKNACTSWRTVSRPDKLRPLCLLATTNSVMIPTHSTALLRRNSKHSSLS